METATDNNEKTLTTTESLAIIEKMIASTRSSFSRNGGAMFLIWGYVTLAVTAAVALTALYTSFRGTVWLWAAIPLIGGVLSWLLNRRRPEVATSHFDSAINAVWRTFYIVAIFAMMYTWLSVWGNKPVLDTLMVVGVTMGAAVMTTAGLLKSITIRHCGQIAAMLACMWMPWWDERPVTKLAGFAMIVIVALIIPGHLLTAAARREARGEVGIDTSKWDALVAAANARKVARNARRAAKNTPK